MRSSSLENLVLYFLEDDHASRILKPYSKCPFLLPGTLQYRHRKIAPGSSNTNLDELYTDEECDQLVVVVWTSSSILCESSK